MLGSKYCYLGEDLVLDQRIQDMTHEIDDFAGQLPKHILEEVKESYSLEDYRRRQNTLYRGALKNSDGHAQMKGKCGDTMQVFLRFDDGRVKEASYETDGCGTSNICGSFAAEMSLGKTPDEILDISGEAILERLGGLPREESHCAFLASETLQEALNDYMIKNSRKKVQEDTERS